MDCNGKKCISIVTLIVAVIVFIQTNFLTIMILTMSFNNNKNEVISVTKEEEQNVSKIEEDGQWKISIPKINVSAEIKEGVDGETINNYVGHFIETPDKEGNICLVAASAGYKENYFSNLKDLQQGDVIIYTKGNTQKEYVVSTNNVIEQTDWSYLSSTEDNRLTLITGILEQPEKRLCVQAIELI